tara:strand:- start:585 stop:908 length:324 start_codon:yes stop_codon:yes gene_type:complete
MNYYKVLFSQKGIMGFREKSDNGDVYFDCNGNAYDKPYDRILYRGIDSATGRDVISYISGSLVAYQDESGLFYAEDGSPIADKWLRKNGWTEYKITDDEPERLDWMA